MVKRSPFDRGLRNPLSPAASDGTWVDLDGTPLVGIFGQRGDDQGSPYDAVRGALAVGGNPARDYWISQITDGGPAAGSQARDQSLLGAIDSYLPGGTWSGDTGGGWLGEEDVSSQFNTGLGLVSQGTGVPNTWARESIVPFGQEQSGGNHPKTGYVHYDDKGEEDGMRWAPPPGWSAFGGSVQAGTLDAVAPFSLLERAKSLLKLLLETPDPESDEGGGPAFTDPITQRRLREFERPHWASDSTGFGGSDPIGGGGSIDWELLGSGGVTDPVPYGDGRFRGGIVAGVAYRGPKSDGGDFQP